jgi:hypothetical protein
MGDKLRYNTTLPFLICSADFSVNDGVVVVAQLEANMGTISFYLPVLLLDNDADFDHGDTGNEG